MKGTLDLDTDTIKCALLDNGYTPDADDDVFSDVSGDELAATGGYTAGGATMAGLTIAQDDTGDKATWDANDVAWTSATFTARYAVIYDTTHANTIIAIIDFGADMSVSAGTFTITWNATGIVGLL